MRRHKKSSKVIDIAGKRVKIVKELGEGGFAYVFLAKDSKSGDQYALKRFVVADEEQASAIKHEIKCWKSLPKHENIVEFMGDCMLRQDPKKIESNNYVYILMEYCSGGSLVDVMQRMQDKGKSFSEKRLLKLFNTACEAVSVMHNHNPPIAHRDIKAENILVTESKTLKLCDFGSALSEVMIPDGASRSLLNRMEDNINRYTTMAFRAPEMLDLYQGKLINEKVDIWALGCLLFKLAFFDDPFDGTQKLQILNCKYSIPEDSSFSNELHSLISTLLDPDPDTRPDIFALLRMVADMLGQSVKIKRRIYEKPISRRFGSSGSGKDSPARAHRKKSGAGKKKGSAGRRKASAAPSTDASPRTPGDGAPADLFGMLDWYDGSGDTVAAGVPAAAPPASSEASHHARKLSGDLSASSPTTQAPPGGEEEDSNWAHFSKISAPAGGTQSDDAQTLFSSPVAVEAREEPPNDADEPFGFSDGFVDFVSSSPSIMRVSSLSVDSSSEPSPTSKSGSKKMKNKKKKERKKKKKKEKEGKKGDGGKKGKLLSNDDEDVDEDVDYDLEEDGDDSDDSDDGDDSVDGDEDEDEDEDDDLGDVDGASRLRVKRGKRRKGGSYKTKVRHHHHRNHPHHSRPGDIHRTHKPMGMASSSAAKSGKGHRRGKSAHVTALPRDLVVRKSSVPSALTPKPDRRKHMTEEVVAAQAARLQPSMRVTPASPSMTHEDKARAKKEKAMLARSAPRTAFAASEHSNTRGGTLSNSDETAGVNRRLTFDVDDEEVSSGTRVGGEPSEEAVAELVSDSLGIPNQTTIEHMVQHMWRTKSAHTFFKLLPKADAKNGVSAVKVISLSHQLMLTAHPSALVGLRDRSSMFKKLSDMWGKSAAPLGRVISFYSALIGKKLKFHVRFPQYEGNYSLDSYFLGVLESGQTFTVGQGSPICNTALLMVMDLLADNMSMCDFIFSDVDTLKMSVAALVPFVQECFALFVISTYLMSKLAATEPPYAIKPLYHYFTHLFGGIKSAFSKIGMLELFADVLPKLPESPPSLSLNHAVRPPVSMNPDLLRRMEEIKRKRSTDASLTRSAGAPSSTTATATAAKGNPRDRFTKSSSLSAFPSSPKTATPSKTHLNRRKMSVPATTDSNPFSPRPPSGKPHHHDGAPSQGGATEEVAKRPPSVKPKDPTAASNPFSSPSTPVKRVAGESSSSAGQSSTPFDPFEDLSTDGAGSIGRNDSLSRIARRQKRVMSDAAAHNSEAISSPKLENREAMPNPFLSPAAKHVRATHNRSTSYFL